MAVKYRWRHKCTRCKRPIKTGEEVWLHSQPYGRNCYDITVQLELAANLAAPAVLAIFCLFSVVLG